ncbi:MAG: hypothetical protein ACI9G1_002303 [Pirellulaceae bacterium]|jgi:hypothetical protein
MFRFRAFKRPLVLASLAVCVGLFSATFMFAQNCCTSDVVASPYDDGCLWCRSHFTGDWSGSRSCLAQNGITFQGGVTQYY